MKKQVKENYWGEAEEQACQLWALSATTKQQSEIYRFLYKKLLRMSEIIANRYFNVPPSRLQELKEECVIEVFLKLHLYQTNRAKSGSYSFCSLLIKHYIMDVIVTKPKAIKNGNNLLDYIENYDGHQQTIDYGNTFDFDEDEVIKILTEKRKNIEEALKRKMILAERNFRLHKTPKPNTRIIEMKIKILNIMIEYIQKYHNLNASNIADYIYNYEGNDISKGRIGEYLRDLFKKRISVSVKDGFSIDDKYNWFDDDVTPNEEKWRKRSKKKKKDLASFTVL